MPKSLLKKVGHFTLLLSHDHVSILEESVTPGREALSMDIFGFSR